MNSPVCGKQKPRKPFWGTTVSRSKKSIRCLRYIRGKVLLGELAKVTQKAWNLPASAVQSSQYWMLFEQENYPQQGRFVTISDTSWYANEEEVIDAVKKFCRNWRR